MKKILLPLFLIATSMGITKLSAYCVYNWSNKKEISVLIYKNPSKSKSNYKSDAEAAYVLSPKGGKGCWHWKSIDKNNRKKLWYWVAYTKSLIKLGEGYFPIGGTITFAGYDKNARAKFIINYDGKPWRYWESPWNHKSRPWKTFKRQ